jgi:DNA-binding MarR family transcriptional regulator
VTTRVATETKDDAIAKILDCQDVSPHDVADMARSRPPQPIQPQLRLLVLERQRFLARLGRRLGVTRIEFEALNELGERGELTPGELGERLSLTSGSVTALLDRLERLGWAARERHPDDRRKVVVRPTAVAQRAAEEELGPLVTAIEDTAARLSARDRQAVERFLAEASDAVAELLSKEHSVGDTPDVAVG